MKLKHIDPRALKDRLDAGEAVLVDIREMDEHARERIPGATPAPLSRFDEFTAAPPSDKILVFHCKSGNRTQVNTGRIVARGFDDAYVLLGGLDAWKAAGLPTDRTPEAPLELQRQVQLAAGALIVAGVVFGYLLTPWAFLLSGFVGGGLMFAGATGFCGMANVLRALPWNRRVAAAIG